MFKFDSERINKEIHMETTLFVRELRDTLRANAPVSSGRYAQSYRMTPATRGSGNVISSGVVFNPLSYAGVIEGGVDPTSDHSWAKAGRKSKGLVYSKGKLWSAKAPGGTIDPLLVDRKTFVNQFARRIGDAIIRGMK